MVKESFLTGIITEEETYKYTIPEILKSRAIYSPEQIAYIYLCDGEEDEEKITYKELDKAARSIAFKLLESNSSGERALMLFPPGSDFIKALYGCFYAGILAVPAYAPRKNRSLERILNIVSDSGSTIVLTVQEIKDSFERSFSDLEGLKNLKWIIIDRISNEPENLTFDHQLAEPEALALLQYTSGSTGLPKGVMVTHRNIVRNLEFIRQSFSLTPESVSVSWLPSFHDMGLIDGVIGAVYNGYTAVLMPPVAFIQKPVRWLRAISKYRGTHGGAPNFAFDLCVDGVNREELKDLDLSCMETLYCGAEPIRKETFERFIEFYKPYGISRESMYPCYGMAETTLIIAGPEAKRGPIYLNVSASQLEFNNILTVPEGSLDSRYLVGVGHSWIDTKVKITNPELMEEIPENHVGEIWVAGSIVTSGYWEKKELTSEIFKASLVNDKEISKTTWLRTGDLGFIHDGELYITGRLKDMIILSGKNYYPQDIEFITEKSHPAIRSAASAAFSVEVGTTEKLVVVAEVERTAIRDLNVEVISEAIRNNIGEEFEQEVYAIVLIRTASILKTSSGKIQRKATRQAFLNNELEVIGTSVLEEKPVPEISTNGYDHASLQAWLMVWIHTKLGVALERIEPNKQIALYGLNSLKAIQLQQDFLKQYGINIPPYLFFDKVTLKQLSERAYNMLLEKQENR